MKKKIALTVSCLLLTGTIAGCSGGQVVDKKEAAGGKAVANDLGEKMTINLMTRSYAGGGWPPNHPIIEELNKKLNIDLKIEWVPSANYPEKLNVLAAANNFPDVFYMTNTEYVKWQERNVFMDVKPELSKYPNITKYIPEVSLQHFNPKDKYYGIPFYYQEARDSLAMRKDWLDKLGLKAPETIDEFYEVTKAFATKDPDGNGKQDTVGFSMEISPGGAFGFKGTANYLTASFGLANKWKLDNGKLVPMQVQSKELKDFIGFMRKAYAEGVLDKDFPILKSRDSLNKLEAGKSGVANVNPQQLYIETLPPLMKVDPKAELVQILPPKGPSGKSGMPGDPTSDKIVINSKLDPKKQQRILKMMDYLLSDEGYDLVKHGIEGVHYKKISDTKYEQLEASTKDRQFLLVGWFFKRFDPMFLIYKWMDPKEIATIKSYFDNNEKVKIANDGFGFVSETATKVGTTIDKKWMDSMVKIIVGQEPIDGIDKVIADWKAAGGDAIIKEMNEQYQKQK
ncbi:extracellular solute-binding protein [Paenibacillus radicis (ex Xue et al. 2023)]|uniref:Extracellular solute-binding protein n=1 Tax=Paenibacillus radicis (ex Xue et al. 2023) TaxID=2972489 RepID=A0ABT1YG41_9BACL|nr:extracellular solute-binding protein [Paenibacillus radicis (ex Xue et al. 2023)]MCR8632161.1 extracellular solute-binding protein [Paenibacillus radicis (ex Xue et al. 2023)]